MLADGCSPAAIFAMERDRPRRDCSDGAPRRAGTPGKRRPHQTIDSPRAPKRAPSATLRRQSETCVAHFLLLALSHIDTFDYKPELLKRHDTPMPWRGRLGYISGRTGQPHQTTLGIQAARPIRENGERPVAQPSGACR
jgi:hypothetical protein